MNRRGVLATLGVALSGGCLDTTRSSSESPPSEFDRPAYAEGFRPHGPWEASRCDSAGTGHNPTSRLPTGDVDAAWLRSVEGSIDPRAVPVTDDRHIYVGHRRSTDDGQQGVVTALEGETGTRAWTTVLEVPTDGDGDDDTSVVTTSRTWDAVGGLARHGETIYVTGHSRHYEVVLLAALERVSGTIDWQVSVPGTEYRTPVTDANGVYLAFGRETSHEGEPTINALYAFSHGRSERWYHRFENGIPRAACVVDSVVFVGLSDGRIVALESDGGTLRWETVADGARTGPVERPHSLAVDGERLYVPEDDRLAALSRDDGSTLWAVDFAERSSNRSPPSVVCREGTIHVGHASELVAVDSVDGTERFRVDDVPVDGSLVGTGDGLVGVSGATVSGFDLEGEKQWSIDLTHGPEEPAEPGPRVLSAHGMVYLGFADGRVYAVGARA